MKFRDFPQIFRARSKEAMRDLQPQADFRDFPRFFLRDFRRFSVAGRNAKAANATGDIATKNIFSMGNFWQAKGQKPGRNRDARHTADNLIRGLRPRSQGDI